MTLIADMVQEMFARDTPPDVILLAIRTAETSRDAIRDASRSVMVTNRTPAATRAARYRENIKQKKGLAKANDIATAGDPSVTTEHDASRDGVTEPCELSSFLPSSEPQQGIQKVSEEKKRTVVVEGKRGTRLSSNALLSADDRKFAVDFGMRDPDASWAEFVDFWIGVPGHRGTKLNWSATWRNRVRAIGSRGKPNGKAPNGLSAALQSLKQHVGEFDRGEEGSEPAPRLLSHG